MQLNTKKHLSVPGLLCRCFTLLELIVVLAIVAIALSYAIPSFNETLANAHLNAAADDLKTHLYTARSEAIKQNIPVTICASADQLTCSGSNDWSRGWIIFTDNSSVLGVKDGIDQIIQVHQPPNGRVSLTADRSHARNLPQGFMN